MTPLIKSGQEHVLSPINLSDVEVGDIVFCKVKGRYYTHLVKAKAELSVCNKTCSLALTVGWLQNTSLGMTISV